MADILNNIFISEIFADNAGTTAIDTDGDGNIKKSDEFIELQNASNTAVSLDGFEIWSGKEGLLFSFGASDTIAAGETATIVGNYTGTPPAGFYDASIKENGNFIPDGENNKFDTIFLVNTNTDEYITLSYGDPPQTPILPIGFPGTTQLGAGESINSDAPNGTAIARNTNGYLVEVAPTPGTPNIPCFLKGTHITTELGEVSVENLEPGDSILTKDHGFLKLRAIGRFAPSEFEMRRYANLAPVTFPTGSIGNTRDLSLSGSHRILLDGSNVEMLFGQAEVLASGRQCVGKNGVFVRTQSSPPEYFHLLFDNHEIICAEGSWVESLFLADIGLRAIEQPSNWCAAKGFDMDSIRHQETARMVIKGFEVALFFGYSRTASVTNFLLAA